ncbi:MAG: hypothetical protein OCC45_04980 [Desulfotalea sp.]
MGNNDTSVKKPLKAIGLDTKREDGVKSMGLVVSRAGLGKTAILVQFALDCMMNNNNVLHVSIGDGVEKASTWYNDIAKLLQVDAADMTELMNKRMIMTFKESNFTKAILAERVEDLVQQEIFNPSCLVIDGYDFVENGEDALEELRVFAKDLGIKMLWFSAVSHRGDDRVSTNGVPAPCHEVDDLFETVLFIQPEGDEIQLKILKCEACAVDPGTILTLDPSTMLIQQG